jgi:glucose-fructose oxidoreductase
MIARRTSKRTRPGGRRVRYAVVGLGYIAQVAVLPAFRNARRNSVLTALVSGDPKKRRTLGRRYGVEHAVPYEDYDALLRSGLVDAVYVALPNSLHREYSVRAANAGVHVLCEKPLAVTSAEALEMVRAAEASRVRLMTAYRLHFERASLEALRLVRSGRIGDPRTFDSVFTRQVQAGNSRLRHDLGGGTLHDLGIYCLNAARTLFGAEPEEVFATSTHGQDARFEEVDESTSAVLRFPGDRVATFTSSFGAGAASSYRVVGTKGQLVVEPAFEYAEGLRHRVTVGSRTTRRAFPKVDQFAPELLAFSDAVLRGADVEPSGWEGLADVRVIEALYDSAKRRAPVELGPFPSLSHPAPGQAMRRPPVDEPPLVRAEPPSKE